LLNLEENPVFTLLVCGSRKKYYFSKSWKMGILQYEGLEVVWAHLIWSNVIIFSL